MSLFSVVIPTFNRAHLIEATLRSVFAQECSDYEIIVADDGSTDGTSEVLARYHDRIRVVRHENSGPGPTRSLGASVANGRYLAFLDSDDLWFPWTLVTYKEAISRYGEPEFIGGTDVRFTRDQELEAIRRAPFAADAYPDYYAASRKPPWFAPGASAIQTQAFRAVGGFAGHRYIAEDADLWMRLGTARGFVRITSPVVLAYRTHPNSAVSNTQSGFLGIRYLVETEKSGGYPGGDARRAERERILSGHARAFAVRLAKSGRMADAWELYRSTFAWQAKQGRARFLLGAPLLLVRAMIARLFRAGRPHPS